MVDAEESGAERDGAGLRGRYAYLAGRFRATWAFHQFLQSLQKLFVEGSVARHASDFKGLYAQLKTLHNLGTGDEARSRELMDAVESQLVGLTIELLTEDRRVTPPLLRQFFQRFANFDLGILTQVLRFYLYCYQDDWPSVRKDKVDLLLTRLAERYAQIGRDLDEELQSLWEILELASPPVEKVEAARRGIDSLRRAISGVENLEELNKSEAISRYRELKHSLGALFFFPALARSILTANLAFKDAVQRLYGREERRIISDYQQIFELEQQVPVDTQTDLRLVQLRQDVERFEQRLQQEDLKLNELRQLRDQVQALLPRLRAASRQRPPTQRQGGFQIPPGAHPLDAAPPAPSRAPASADPEVAIDGLIRDHYEGILEAVAQVGAAVEPEVAAESPEVFPYRLEPREVLALRRLRRGEPCDRELETFVAVAAALRVRMSSETVALRSIITEASAGGPSINRHILQLADEHLWRFSYMLGRAVRSGEAAEAQELETLRMRLMHEYSRLWLLVCRPGLAENAEGA